jgi:hypothetical protein
MAAPSVDDLARSFERRQLPVPVVEVDTGGERHDEDGGGEPVDDQAERWPPAGVGNELATVWMMPKTTPTARGAGSDRPASGLGVRADVIVSRLVPGMAGASRATLLFGDGRPGTDLVVALRSR